MNQARSQVIFAPSNDAPRGVKSVFLAGTTEKVGDFDWRELLSTALSDVPITIYNPYRADWDSSWHEDINFAPYREQVE
ncbi:nucleoside 2-deoxyribosyltransferase like domain-containing protein [Penicillium verhagenii]|uniref:nucleoside 2-deoxyribosyltransferase like domain-containing protein n=1 Tax=Penicillium verhagenii TaxID=1562060 RepID=UPI002545942F|nr:nucleoside 2-deoxyribosyltransferase like domain-containing protein [Penicillium verhagenii]KAJ5921153.1 nucleoside 2-deoxyribosyltransferase like domain-containing protein [Penicillium verhagenii]